MVVVVVVVLVVAALSPLPPSEIHTRVGCIRQGTPFPSTPPWPFSTTENPKDEVDVEGNSKNDDGVDPTLFTPVKEEETREIRFLPPPRLTIVSDPSSSFFFIAWVDLTTFSSSSSFSTREKGSS